MSPDFFLLFLLTFIAGLIYAWLGGGSGVLIVTLLPYLSNLNVLEAVQISLLMGLLISFLNSIVFQYQKLILWSFVFKSLFVIVFVCFFSGFLIGFLSFFQIRLFLTFVLFLILLFPFILHQSFSFFLNRAILKHLTSLTPSTSLPSEDSSHPVSSDNQSNNPSQAISSEDSSHPVSSDNQSNNPSQAISSEDSSHPVSSDNQSNNPSQAISWDENKRESILQSIKMKFFYVCCIVSGASLGLTGIGGGVILSPFFHESRLISAKNIPAVISVLGVFMIGFSFVGQILQKSFNLTNSSEIFVVFLQMLPGYILGSILGYIFNSKQKNHQLRKQLIRLLVFTFFIKMFLELIFKSSLHT